MGDVSHNPGRSDAVKDDLAVIILLRYCRSAGWYALRPTVNSENELTVLRPPARLSMLREASNVERCPSGLRSTLGKRVCGKPHRGFESHPLRHPNAGGEPSEASGVGWMADLMWYVYILSSEKDGNCTLAPQTTSSVGWKSTTKVNVSPRDFVGHWRWKRTSRCGEKQLLALWRSTSRAVPGPPVCVNEF